MEGEENIQILKLSSQSSSGDCMTVEAERERLWLVGMAMFIKVRVLVLDMEIHTPIPSAWEAKAGGS